MVRFLIPVCLIPLVDGYRVAQRASAETDSIDVDASDDRFIGFCPDGLEANQTEGTCTYHGEMLDDPDHSMDKSWAGGSQHPLVFTHWGGLENVQMDLMHEMHFLMSDRSFVRSLTELISAHHMGENRSALAIYDAELEESLERDEANLEPIDFAVTQAVHHVAELGIEEALLHVLANTAAAAYVPVFFHIAGPVLIGVETYHLIHHFRHHVVTKDAHAREFTVAMVAKSDCIRSKVTLRHEQMFDDDDHLQPNVFIPEFEGVCGVDVGAQLGAQMLRTNQAMLSLMDSLKGIGKCLFPEGSRPWAKSNCVNAIDDNLHSHEHQPGVLQAALSLSAAYGVESDRILSNKFYSDWFERYFNISSPHFTSDNVHSDLIRLKENSPSLEERSGTCMSIVALHRAFERTFVRVKTALNIYMHSFALDVRHWSLRTSHHPCRRVIKPFAERASGMCIAGEELPEASPESAWVGAHIGAISKIEAFHTKNRTKAMIAEDAAECIEDVYPELRLHIFNEGRVEGNEHGHDE